ncbi:outer membrane beta-barrel protein, partial [Flavihumibacter sp. CACIAM 22H1]|uniref:outer membrane beta-barrel protein n=1 Tax=Flavihumibacter sp. CACIAM 22H1 TaxID=1812911 RepID=UPI0025B8C52B
MKNIFVHLFLFIPFITAAQDSSSTGQVTRPFSISGYLEAYYSYDFNKPANNTRPGFLYNFNRHNEFTLNLGFIKASYLTERTRANLAIGVGTYMNANYAAEPGLLKNIVEANAGYKLSATKNLWFDIGIQPSHIGFEAAVGRDNWTLTRSMVAENTPYFESGAKLSFTTNDEKLIISAMVLNGWQRITRLNGNSLLSWGTQLTYKPNEKITMNYSTFIG